MCRESKVDLSVTSQPETPPTGHDSACNLSVVVLTVFISHFLFVLLNRNCCGCCTSEATWTGESLLLLLMNAHHVIQTHLLQMFLTSPTPALCRYPMAMGTLADLEDQDPIPGKENPLKIHLKVSPSRTSRPSIPESDWPLIRSHCAASLRPSALLSGTTTTSTSTPTCTWPASTTDTGTCRRL